jgi:hypothetical protein
MNVFWLAGTAFPMTPELWLVVIVSVALLSGVIAVEETRVSEAHRDEQSWRKRVCTHGSTTFQAGEGDDYARSQVGRQR